LTTDKKRQPAVGLIVLLGIFAAVELINWLSPAIGLWNEQIADRILAVKTASTSLRPEYSDTVAIVDLNNSSLRQLNDYHPGRAHYAKVIQNLSRMGVSLQMFDIVFAGRRSQAADRSLIESAGNARDVIFGMVLRLVDRSAPISSNGIDAETKTYLDKTAWRDLDTAALPALYRGIEPVISLAGLGQATKGMGFLTLAPDRDGVFRRLPLLVKYEDAVYPSFALKAVCEFLKIPPSNVVIGKRSIRLTGTSRPGHSGHHDIEIPVDRNGSAKSC